MRPHKTPDFYVNRVLYASEDLLVALNHYSYQEAVAVLDWIRARLESSAVIKIIKPIGIEADPDFPVRLPPNRKFIYSIPQRAYRRSPIPERESKLPG
ncbi:hypothetical protein [Pectobacterium cacticida]|uniref:hypothetical protein n=1 Tax=Pectobacterium cacticida TaxID=69221 RepID=UPI0039865A0A